MACELFPTRGIFAVCDDRLGEIVRFLDILLLVAAVFFVVGFAMIWLPMAPIVAGICLVAAWWLLGEVRK